MWQMAGVSGSAEIHGHDASKASRSLCSSWPSGIVGQELSFENCKAVLED